MRRLYLHLEEILGSILLVVLCSIAFFQVTARYLFNSPPTWTEEAGTFVFVYLVFIGAALALKKNEHFALELLVEQFPLSIQRWVRVFVAVLVIVCAGFITWYGTLYMLKGWNTRTPGLEIPRAVPVAAVPLGGLLMIVRGVENLFRHLSHKIVEPPPVVNPAS